MAFIACFLIFFIKQNIYCFLLTLFILIFCHIFQWPLILSGLGNGINRHKYKYKYSCYSLTLKPGTSWGPLVLFLLGCYGNDQLLSFDFVLWLWLFVLCLFDLCPLTCVNQSAQSSRNRFPPYRPVAQKNPNLFYYNKLPRFEPGSAASNLCSIGGAWLTTEPDHPDIARFSFKFFKSKLIHVRVNK